MWKDNECKIVLPNTDMFDNTSYTLEANIVKESIFYTLEIVTNCILINIVGMFGIVGNFINISVLWKHGLRETTNIILISLSVSDFLFSIILPITRLKCLARHIDIVWATNLHTFVTVYLLMPKYIFLASSFNYVTVIAIERFVAVFFPFKVSQIFKRGITIFIVICIPITILTFLFPTFFALTYSWRYDSCLNETVAVIEYTHFYSKHQEFLDFYAWVGLNMLFGLFSTVIVFICCVAISIKLFRAALKRELMTSKTTGYDVRVVKMLVAVCVVFLAVDIPNLVMYSYFVPNFIFVSSLHELVDNICVLLYAVNSSANFVVYVTMSKKFAKTYKTLMICRKRNMQLVGTEKKVRFR